MEFSASYAYTGIKLCATCYFTGSPGLDIFVVSRSEEYLIDIPRPTLIGRQCPRSDLGHENNFVGLAPDYEEPPTYEECVRNGLA